MLRVGTTPACHKFKHVRPPLHLSQRLNSLRLQVRRRLRDAEMGERGGDRDGDRALAQDVEIVAGTDSYGPMDGQQVKVRLPPPAPW